MVYGVSYIESHLNRLAPSPSMGDQSSFEDAAELERKAISLQQVTADVAVPAERHLPDWYLDFEAELAQLEHNIRNEAYQPFNKKEPWKQVGKAMMNEEGTARFIGFMRSTAFGRNILMSYFPTERMARHVARDVCQSVNTWLHRAVALGTYGLQMENIPYINDFVRPIVFGACMRAYMGKESSRAAAMGRQGMIGMPEPSQGAGIPVQHTGLLGGVRNIIGI